MEIPETHYAPSGEIMIAYQVYGSGEHDLLYSGGSASNVETEWHFPEAARFFERLGRFARVILFDRRDAGVSDPIREDLTLESHVADALAVVDAVGVERPVLLGAADSARAFAALAAVHPDRAGGLIGIACSPRGAGDVPPQLIEEIIEDMVSGDWPAGIIDLLAPEWADDPVRRDRLARYMRTAMTPRQARRTLKMSASSDLSEVLPLVQAPTLVLAPEEVRSPSPGPSVSSPS